MELIRALGEIWIPKFACLRQVDLPSVGRPLASCFLSLVSCFLLLASKKGQYLSIPLF